MRGKSETIPLLSIRNPLNKIRQYLSTFELTRGFFIALLSALFIYLEHWTEPLPLLTTFSGLLALYLLLKANAKTWLFSGFFIGLFWFWWVGLSFEHYQMPWAIPIVIFAMGVLYALLFGLVAWGSEKIATIPNRVGWDLPPKQVMHSHETVGEPTLRVLILRMLGLLTLSYIHPFGFDWFKPELMFVNSYLGIEKWQFALILTALLLSIWRRQYLFLLLLPLAYQPHSSETPLFPTEMRLVTTHTTVEEKWDEKKQKAQFDAVFREIDRAIEEKKKLIVFPESIFPLFLNYKPELIAPLHARSKKISIVLGALYWDGKIPYNSAYIIRNGKVTIANKVLLVPFGEQNPLPDFLSDWVNRVFYDGAVDYKASQNVVDYTIEGVTYRNAICFEATSEALYVKNAKGERPAQMIVLSNNGWFVPSIEPTLQRLLLQYYSRKYGTTIYHAVNMSPSYMIKKGTLVYP